MVLNKLKKVSILTVLLLISSCGQDDIVPVPEPNDSIVGFSTVELNANKPVVRGGEAVLGNLVADSFAAYARSQNHNIDFAVANGGNIRFDSALRPDGIYPAGNITQDNAHEILPFNNTGIVIEITGAELKSTFERSVYAIPVTDTFTGSGAFMQLSSGIQIVVDINLPAQILDELNGVERIVSEGQRVIQVSINGEPMQLDKNYLVLIPSYAAGGGDGFVALGAINSERRVDLGIPLVEALIDYLNINSPITPIIENRILVVE